MILMPMSSIDFDPSEASIAWKLLQQEGIQVVFATLDGKPAEGDFRMLTGKGLGILKPILMARKDAIEAYNEMIRSSSYLKPIKYEEILESDFKGIMLHGGHAPGIKNYLESITLQKVIVDFIKANKPLGAICHGVLLLARSLDESGKSVLSEKNCTCLLKSQEIAAYNLTRLWLRTYYRTYPSTTTQEEVISFLSNPKNFK